jgi:hypothetical protein
LAGIIRQIVPLSNRENLYLNQIFIEKMELRTARWPRPRTYEEIRFGHQAALPKGPLRA